MENGTLHFSIKYGMDVLVHSLLLLIMPRFIAQKKSEILSGRIVIKSECSFFLPIHLNSILMVPVHSPRVAGPAEEPVGGRPDGRRWQHGDRATENARAVGRYR